MEIFMSTTYSNAQSFVRAAVADMLSALTGNLSSTRMRLVSTTSNSSYSRFVWIMVERIAPGTTGDSVIARTNDMDLTGGVPPSLYVTAPLARTQDLEVHILNFLDTELLNYGKVEALLQSDMQDRTACATFVGDSESGYANITEQVSLLTV
jgi:hypothetical protein